MRSSRWIAVCVLITMYCVAYGLNVLTVGDYGDSTANGRQRQETVARAMSAYCLTNPCDFIFSTADNFYENGVTSLDDVRFNDSWRWVYDKPGISDLVWYQILGNHDYGSTIFQPENREQNQILFSQIEPRWILPWLWYDFYRNEADFSVHFIVVDSMSIIIPKYQWEYELEWYRETLATSTGDWKIVVVHHPPYSTGNYGPGDTKIRNALVALAEIRGRHTHQWTRPQLAAHQEEGRTRRRLRHLGRRRTRALSDKHVAQRHAIRMGL